MKILKLILKGYTRLQLNQIAEFVYTPTDSIQIIIGTNGSGKSSILEELSPLPADSKYYFKGGSKEIWITKGKNTYAIKSSFDKKDSHSFIENDIELNDGGTVTVQLELVRKYFSYTPETHKLALGHMKFHAMKPPQRKDLFMKLADANYDYAIAYYNRLKQRYNDTVSGLRLERKRIVTESTKVLPQEEFDRIKEETKDLHSSLDFLMEHRVPPNGSNGPIEQQLRVVEQTLSQITKSHCRRYYDLASEPVLDIDQLRSELDDIKAIIRSYELTNTRLFEEFEKINEAYQTLQLSHSKNIFTLDSQIRNEESMIEELLSKRSLRAEPHPNPELALEIIQTHEDRLITLLEALPGNQDKIYSRAKLDTYREQQAEIDEKLRITKGFIVEKQGTLQHYESMKSEGTTECPNCKHSWIRGYNPIAVSSLKDSLETLEKDRVILQQLSDEVATKIAGIYSYFNKYQAFIAATNQLPVLNPLWDHLNKTESIINNPSIAMQEIKNYSKDLAYEIKCVAARARIKELTDLVSVSKLTVNLDFDKTKERKEQLEEQIAKDQKDYNRTIERKNYLDRTIASILAITDSREQLSKLIDQHASLNSELEENTRRLIYSDFVREIQSMLARSENVLRESEGQYRVIASIQANIDQLEVQERILKIVLKELSPTEGLIAEGLFGFMRIFVKQMNEIIQRIWTYPLKVMPCSVEEGQKLDLNYKFPVFVNKQEKPKDDVSEGSTAMKEVIDLAFTITAMKALKLGDFPLFLDEFGHSMDPVHKEATTSLINTIMQQESFSQLFMISHDMLQYGSLTNTQVLVLCADNITIPKHCVYNTHVTMN